MTKFTAIHCPPSLPTNGDVLPYRVLSEEWLNWDTANYNWDCFYADQYYADYILKTYNVTIPGPPYGVTWDYAIQLEIELLGGDGPDTTVRKKKRKKTKDEPKSEDRIRLIFITNNALEVCEKIKNNDTKVQVLGEIENILTEKFNQTVKIKDVQIIHG
jgi:hypothetical protein